MSYAKNAIGRLLCRWRELTGRKPVHRYVRRMVTDENPAIKTLVAGVAPVRVCRRCGHTVPVKTRGPRKAKV